jgi:hypothetical protein
MVEKNERPDHAPLGKWQDTPNFQQPDAAPARGNDEGEHGCHLVTAGLDPAIHHARQTGCAGQSCIKLAFRVFAH